MNSYVANRNGRLDNQHKSSTPPPSAQPPAPAQRHLNRDRAAISQTLKVHQSEKGNSPKLSTTAPPRVGLNTNHRSGLPTDIPYQQPGFEYPSSSGRPIKISGSQTTQLQEVPQQGNIFDDTITSDIEHTKSDVQARDSSRVGYADENLEDDGFDPNNGVEQEYGNRKSRQDTQNHRNLFGQSTHDVQTHRKSRSSYGNPASVQQPNHNAPSLVPGNNIAGRFGGGGGLAHRSSPSFGAQGQHVEQGFSNEHDYEDDGRARINTFESIRQDDHDESEDEYKESLPAHPVEQNGHEHESEGAHSEIDPRSESGQSNVNRRQTRVDTNVAMRSQNQADQRNQPDYTDEQLGSMKYVDLKKETWDTKTDPNTNKSTNGKRSNPTPSQEECSVRESAEAAVSEAFMLGKELGNKEESDPALQARRAKIFANLTMEEYEEAGDIFIEKFSKLMKKMREARKKKRQVAAQFEDELEAREKDVRGKSDILEQKFKDMKTGGESVLKGRV